MEPLENLQKQESYENLKNKINRLLNDFEDLETDLSTLKDVKNLAEWIGNLDLDPKIETKAIYLADSYNDMKQAFNGLLKILYELKKEVLDD